MKYALLIYGDENVWASMSRADMEKTYEAHRRYGEAMVRAGVLRGGEVRPVVSHPAPQAAGDADSQPGGTFDRSKVSGGS
jgi:hypothetical protein